MSAECSDSITIPSHKRRAWAVLGYILLVPLLFSPVIMFDLLFPFNADKLTFIFILVGAFVGVCILVYHYYFAIHRVILGPRIVLEYAARQECIAWDAVTSVYIERRYGNMDGVPIEVFKLNLIRGNIPLEIDVSPSIVSSIISVAKAKAPESCSVSTEVKSVRVR